MDCANAKSVEAALLCGAVAKLFYGEVSNDVARQRTIYLIGGNKRESLAPL